MGFLTFLGLGGAIFFPSSSRRVCQSSRFMRFGLFSCNLRLSYGLGELEYGFGDPLSEYESKEADLERCFIFIVFWGYAVYGRVCFEI